MAVKYPRYTLPAEHEPQSHVLMAFPSIESAESEEQLEALQKEVTTVAKAIAQFEPVHLYVKSELQERARSMVGPNVKVKPATVTQLWIRDSGPVYVRDLSSSAPTAIPFNFNYWGAKWPSSGDESLAAHIIQDSGTQAVETKLRLEGGGIEHDGEGTFLGTESCIINDNRNKGWTKEQIEEELRRLFDISHFIWTPGVRNYDITDFHIDALARFVKPGVVILSKPGANADASTVKAYEDALAILSKSKDAKGRSLIIHECEEADTSKLEIVHDEDAVVTSYVNYLLVNGAVMIPRFGQDEVDRKALKLLTELFPERQVVQVDLNMLPRYGGGIHCATQHVPAYSS